MRYDLLDSKSDFVFKGILGRCDIKEIKSAKDELIKISADKKQRALYDMRQKAIHDEANALMSAKEQGKEEGKIEGKIESAKAFLDLLNDEEIAQRLGLDIDIVCDIRRGIL